MADLTRALAQFDLVSPWLLVAAAAICLLVFIWPRGGKRRSLALDLQYWRRRVPLQSRRLMIFGALAASASLLITTALAEPRMTVKPSVSIYGKPVVAVVDVSGSMGSTPKAFVGGVENRDKRNGYEKARDIFLDLIGRRPDVNFALVLYSTENYVARYFSYKNELLTDTVENKQEIEHISTGTRTADALAKARRFLTSNVSGRDKAIVLISDLDQDLAAMVATAEELEIASNAGIRTYVILITADDKKPALPVQNQILKIVEMNDAAGIDRMVQELAEMQSSPLREEAVAQKQSLIPCFTLPALGLIALALVLTETRWRKLP